MYFLAYIGLTKHYVADVAHIKPLQRANSGFLPDPIIGSVQGQDRREPNTCGRPSADFKVGEIRLGSRYTPKSIRLFVYT